MNKNCDGIFACLQWVFGSFFHLKQLHAVAQNDTMRAARTNQSRKVTDQMDKQCAETHCKAL